MKRVPFINTHKLL